LNENTQPVALSEQPSLWRRWRDRLPTDVGVSLWEFVILIFISAYFLFYGLVPFFGGDQIGLVGADEPRYAQIAREMLAAHSEECHEVHARITPHSLRAKDLHASYECLVGGTVTPILYGRPWLEKPALYYWRAMSFFKEFGVSDWSARLPSATGAGALIILAFLHLRRFRPGGHLDAALIMVSMAGMVGFSRGASTDMQLAAPLSIGLLGWYAWYETGKKFWLFDLYFFGAAATLAKGPIAIFLMLGTIMLFLGLRREWSAIRRTIWLPGFGLFLLMVLPWYIEVQRKNPHFFRIFFLEHNLERFATDRYQHSQHWFYYAFVLIVAMLPWTALALRALWDGMAVSIDEWKVRHKPQRYLGHVRAGDAFPEFLVLWALSPRRAHWLHDLRRPALSAVHDLPAHRSCAATAHHRRHLRHPRCSPDHRRRPHLWRAPASCRHARSPRRTHVLPAPHQRPSPRHHVLRPSPRTPDSAGRSLQPDHRRA
jgi:hypothetical protein